MSACTTATVPPPHVLQEVDVRRRHALKEVPANQVNAVASWEVGVGGHPHLVRLVDDRRAAHNRQA